jgi:hypothetical protein
MLESDATREVLKRNGTEALGKERQMAIEWSRWESLGKPQETELGRPFANHNQDGRLEVFAIGLGGIFNIWQVFPNGGWRNGWLSKDRPTSDIRIKSHVVGRNADGRQEIFAAADDDAIWQKWQVTPNSGWSEWKTLGTPGKDTRLTERFTVGRNQDGRQELFAIGSDGEVWQIWQTAPNGGWSDWRRLGKPPAEIRRSDRITLGSNEDGRQELFVMGRDDALWHIWQVAPNVGWSDWTSLGRARDQFDFPVQSPEPPKDRDLSEPVVQRNADGHLEVFAPGNGAFCNRWQERPIFPGSVWRREGWNAKPKPSDAVGLTWLEVALNFQNRLEVVASGSDGGLWHAWQVDVPPFWSKWESLGNPPAKIRLADHLTIGINQDRRLEVFVVGDQDGAVWHIWQIR